MVWPTAGSQVNVPGPEPDRPDEAEPDDDPGTTTVYDPASPSVPFSCVCSVSDPRVTPFVLVAYPLLLAAGLAELNTPAAGPPAACPPRRAGSACPTDCPAPPAPACPPAAGSPACSRASVLLIAYH